MILRRWLPWRRYYLAGEVDAADEAPSSLPRRGVVVVADAGRTKWAIFDCPCDRRHRLMLNLDPRRRPYWRLGRRLTITPSVDALSGGRRCHFVLQSGRVRWLGARPGSRRVRG